MLKKIVLLFVVLMAIGTTANAEIFGDINCKMGQLAPGFPLYICEWRDGVMDHSFFDHPSMIRYYTPGFNEEIHKTTWHNFKAVGGSTETLTAYRMNAGQ